MSKIAYSEEQMQAIRRFGKDLLVFAGAGSGKTTLLAERFLHAVVREKIAPDKILAITFTERAANEMKMRVIRQCEQEGFSHLRQAFESAPISTIHSFCARVLRENPIEARLDPFFRILSEGEAELFMEKILDALFEEQSDNAVWIEMLSDYGEAEMREALKHFYDLSRATADDKRISGCPAHRVEVRKAFSHMSGWVKRMLTELKAKADPLPAETRLKEALERFLAVASAGSRNESLAVARILELGDGLDRLTPKTRQRVAEFQELIGCWAPLAAEEILSPAKREFSRVFFRFKALVESEKRKKALYDFEDLVYLAHKLFSDPSPQARAALSRYQDLFSCVLVDEYQDTSPLQAALIGFLKKRNRFFFVGDAQQSIYGFRHADPQWFRDLAEGTSAARRYEKVSLSQNRRSRREILEWVNRFFQASSAGSRFLALSAAKHFSDAKPHVLELLCVTRDREKIPTLEKARIAEAKLLARRIRELAGPTGLCVQQASGPSRPAGYGDFAILVKSTSSSHLYEKELSAAGIPFHVLKGKGFYEKPEIVDILSCLTLLENPDDDIALACVLRSPLVAVSEDALFWLASFAKSKSNQTPLSESLDRLDSVTGIAVEDRKALEAFVGWVGELRKKKDRMKLPELISEILRRTQAEAKLLAGEDGRQKLANVRKLAEIARAMRESEITGAGDFVRFVKGLSDQEAFEAEARVESGSGNAVTISTVHAAKGLEFPCVIIADMGAGRKKNVSPPVLSLKKTGLGMKWLNPLTRQWVPDFTYSQIHDELRRRDAEEDERVLYVAMTRAKEHLILSGSAPAEAKPGASSWMDKVLSVLGREALASPGSVADCNGVRVHVVKSLSEDPEENPAVGPVLADRLGLKNNRLETKNVRILPVPNFVDYTQRLKPPHKPYTETQDLTVTDLAVRSLGETARAAVRREQDRWLGAAEEDEPETPRNEFGTLFHKLMEIMVSDRSRPIQNRLFRSAFLSGLSAAEKKEIRQSALNFWDSSLGRSVRASAHCYPELPFIYKTKHGVLKGQIDLVFRTRAGEWILVDYKTSKMKAAEKKLLAGPYEIQLGLYALVFGRLYGEPPTKGVLYFSSINETSEFSYRPEDFAKYQQRLEEAFERTAAGLA